LGQADFVFHQHEIAFLCFEHSFVDGKDLYFIPCIWVHGYKQGRGSFQRRGMGKALLKAAEEDIKNRGARGIAAWGVSLPFWMKASWFKKQGYKKVDKKGSGYFSGNPLPVMSSRPNG
jgi:N-acetylglutamate synthase-like GNAT family acetyltransferase